MSKVLITGGAGFIGSVIADELQQAGEEVYILDNLSTGKRENVAVPDSRFFAVDLLDTQKLNAAVVQINPDKIIHLAAIHYIPYFDAHAFESSNINVMGIINLLNAAEKLTSLKVFCFASSASVYPITSKAITEDTVTSPIDLYGLSKLMGEKICRNFFLSLKVPTLICRFFNVYGHNDPHMHIIPAIQKQLIKNKTQIKLGDLTVKRDFTHTRDIAIAVRLLLSKFSEGFDIFNIGSGHDYSVEDLIHIIQLCRNKKFKVESDVSRLRPVDRPRLLSDITKIKKFINWKPSIDFKDGLQPLFPKIK